MRKIVLKMVLHLLTSIGLLSLVLIGGFFVMRQLSFQSTLSLAEAVNQQGGISEMREVSLGGISQYIAIEGENRDNPVCLFLHGGPGLSLPYGVSSRHQVETVSSHCNVVYWDQRGAGKTYSQNKEAVDFTYAQLESDAKELIAYLREEFDQEKIYLIGYSWGSVLGLRLAAKIPEQLAGYFGLSQVVSSRDSERLLYDWLLDEFETTGRHQLVTQLKKLGLPPYQKESSQQAFQEVMTQSNAYVKWNEGLPNGFNVSRLINDGGVRYVISCLESNVNKECLLGRVTGSRLINGNPGDPNSTLFCDRCGRLYLSRVFSREINGSSRGA